MDFDLIQDGFLLRKRNISSHKLQLLYDYRVFISINLYCSQWVFDKVLCGVLQGEHPEDSQGSGGGH